MSPDLSDPKRETVSFGKGFNHSADQCLKTAKVRMGNDCLDDSLF